MKSLKFFNFFSSTKKETKHNVNFNDYPKDYIDALEFNSKFNSILNQDKFIARSDYKDLIHSYSDSFSLYNTLIESNIIGEYIKKNNLKEDEIYFFIEKYNEIKDLTIESKTVREHNDIFLEHHLLHEKEFLDNVLKECDPNILLDEEQRKVILSDEDHTLVIAGAGTGKTTTVAAKVRYLVQRKGINPNNILVISFTNKAVEELRDRINHSLKIPCPITTFHSIGYAILSQSEKERKKVVDTGFMYNVIGEYLKSTILKDNELINKLIKFFGSYFSAPYEGDNLNEYFQFVAKADFSTLKSNLHEYTKQVIDRRTNKIQTINSEILRSIEEVRIANFLYLNQIDYEYEPIYQYPILDSNKPYTPDFIIKQDNKVSYIEHFGITEKGQNSRYNTEELEKYKSRINDKIRLHRKHKTDLIYTFSEYNDGINFLEHLRSQLIQRGYILRGRPIEQVYKNLINSEENKYITKLNILLCTFISNFKTQGYKFEKFSEFRNKSKNVRTKLFLDICSACYCEYQKKLEEQHCIDFEDMINDSADVIREKQITKERLDYKYIIVDEYQDISRQRYNLIKELSLLCNAKIVAVGDDWQSIYAFSGAILPLFTKFCKEVGYGEELKITHTYRNSQEIIDIAGSFVQKNSSQIKKRLISPKHITNPITIYTYNEDPNKFQNLKKDHYLGIKINSIIEDIIEFHRQENKPGIISILLLGRYGFDARRLCFSKEFNYDEKTGKIYSVKYGNKIKLNFLTVHSSKGLSADNVIIINTKDNIYGFPSKVDDDPILNLVVSNDISYNYAEERRLFYVALTRTRNRVFIATPERRPSIFIKEILKDTISYPNVTLKGELHTDLSITNEIKYKCPICGYPLQLRYNKNYGLKLWICTNDQELCGFMTNNLNGGKLSIQKCDWCKDGYLIVKGTGTNVFLGCTNYKEDKSGCGRYLSLEHYNIWKNEEFGKEDISRNLKSYLNNTLEDVPKIPIPNVPNEKDTKIRRKATVNQVRYDEIEFEGKKIKVLVNNNGIIITDILLLKQLSFLNRKIAKEQGIKSYMVFPYNTLVYLATDKPTTREEMLEIRGVGEIKYNKYGELFISEIRKFTKSEL